MCKYIVVNACCIYWGMGVRKALDSKSNLQGRSTTYLLTLQRHWYWCHSITGALLHTWRLRSRFIDVLVYCDLQIKTCWLHRSSMPLLCRRMPSTLALLLSGTRFLIIENRLIMSVFFEALQLWPTEVHSSSHRQEAPPIRLWRMALYKSTFDLLIDCSPIGLLLQLYFYLVLFPRYCQN